MKKHLLLIHENNKIAINSIKSNLLRTILTVLIIAIGIMSLVGILTAIDALKGSISQQFSSMGASTFTIENWSLEKSGRGHRIRQSRAFEDITFRQAQTFKQKFTFPSKVSIVVNASGSSTIKYKEYKSNPNIPVVGTDENYIYTSGLIINNGRFFTEQEIRSSKNIVVIGSDLAKKTFKKEDPINKIISIGSSKYRVIGVLTEKGSGMGSNFDKMCLIPITNARSTFGGDYSYTIQVMPIASTMLETAIGEAEGTFRQVRGLKIIDKSNFEIKKSDNLAKMMLENITFVTISATFIGMITLLGAAIGLMNIMLVSVSERTKEIGIRKAIGAKRQVILQQFLFEAILIGQIGGAVGIVLGIMIGNVVSLATGSGFIVPWLWIIGGAILCFGVGLVSGIFPAIKASKLDPIEALRHE